MRRSISNASIKEHGWMLVSAIDRHSANPDTFGLPCAARLASLRPGQAVKLLFDIETRENGEVVGRGVDRMWVVVTQALEHGFVGILDSNPGFADGLALSEGDEITFSRCHVSEIEDPPRDYLKQKYGSELGSTF